MCAVRAWESLSSPPAAMLGLGLARRQSSIFLFEMGGEDAVDCVKHRLEALAHAGQAQAYEEPAAGKAVIELRPSGRDRKSVVEGKSVSVRVDLGGRRIIKKKTTIGN